MNRRNRRSISKKAKKEYKKALIKKDRINSRLIEMGIHDGLEEINEFSRYWLFTKRVKGPKIAPTTTYRFKGLFKGLMERFNVENLYIGWFGYVLKIKNWTIRSKYKPKGAVWRYVFTFRKRVV